MASATDDTTRQLAWEARQRPRAAVAALLAGALTFGADLWASATFSNAPHAAFVRSLQQALAPGPIGGRPSQRTAFFVFYHDHAGALIGSSIVRAVGYVGVGWAITFLAAAVRARREEFPRVGLYVTLVGALLEAISLILSTVASAASVSDFLSGPRTVDAAADVTSGSAIVTAQFIGLAGSLALAAGLVLVCLNAMRAGLLTRFMGVLGIIVGVLVIFPFGPLPVVQSFWLIALGALLIGRWPYGEPPAWRSGRAEPWPSQRELAERRRGGRPGAADAEGTPETPEQPRVARPGASRRKRKRRA